MLRICNTIFRKEIKPILQCFPVEKIITCARKAKTGLGISLGNSATPNSRIIKIRTTSEKGAFRALYLIVFEHSTSRQILYPILFRPKKDKKIGENFSFKNKAFKKYYEKNLLLTLEDVRLGNFKEYNL